MSYRPWVSEFYGMNFATIHGFAKYFSMEIYNYYGKSKCILLL